MSEKLKLFRDICGDWDYRSIDMTNPHIQGIDIIQNNIYVRCELFSPEIDDYVSCDGGVISNKKLIKSFEKLNLDNKSDVLKFISKIEDKVNWKEVEHNLGEEVMFMLEYEKSYEEFIQMENRYKHPCKKLGEDWHWYKYDDGSGCLKSLDGKQYMEYDLSTNEYKPTPKSTYRFLPCSDDLIDEIDNICFDIFEYMEKEMIDYILPKENEKEEVCL